MASELGQRLYWSAFAAQQEGDPTVELKAADVLRIIGEYNHCHSSARKLVDALESMLGVFKPRDEPGPDAYVEHAACEKARTALMQARGEAPE